MTNKKIAILAVGSEIIRGECTNTNAVHIAAQLFNAGVATGAQMAIDDDHDQINFALETLARGAAAIVVIGGLGPTSDDLTRHAVASFARRPLALHEPSRQHVQARLLRFQIPWGDHFLVQALMPTGCEVLENKNGAANGFRLDVTRPEGDVELIVLPGPPKECLPLFEELLPRLAERYAAPLHFLGKWRTLGIIESDVAKIVDEASLPPDVGVSYRWTYPFVDLSIWAHSHLDEDVMRAARERIDARLQGHVLPERRPASALARERARPLRIVDGATNGALARALAGTPIVVVADGTGDVFVRGLDALAQGLPFIGRTTITLARGDGRQIAHDFPFRGPEVLDYAVEWICMQLLNQSGPLQ